MSAVVSPVALSSAFAPNPVLIKGEGKPVVFLHGVMGQEWNGMLDKLAETRTVYAPAHPGSIEADDLKDLHSFWELILYYDDLFAGLGLEQFDLIGHSFGGMVAAEYAATFPTKIGKLVLIDAMGLWSDDHPVEDHLLASEETRRGLFYHDQDHPQVVERLTDPADPDAARDAFIARFLALASSSHFIHPIPERGLNKRLRRITAPTLLLWGGEDRLTPPAYAQDFHSAIERSRIALIVNAGHVPFVEQQEAVSKELAEFFA